MNVHIPMLVSDAEWLCFLLEYYDEHYALSKKNRGIRNITAGDHYQLLKKDRRLRNSTLEAMRMVVPTESDYNVVNFHETEVYWLYQLLIRYRVFRNEAVDALDRIIKSLAHGIDNVITTSWVAYATE